LAHSRGDFRLQRHDLRRSFPGILVYSGEFCAVQDVLGHSSSPKRQQDWSRASAHKLSGPHKKAGAVLFVIATAQ
jgi:integrase